MLQPSRTPSPYELVAGAPAGAVVWRKNVEQIPVGQATVALGTLALTFATLRIKRARAETALIQRMWQANTTVRGLRETAQAGAALPDCVLLRGALQARGAPVASLASRVPQLKPLWGRVDQPGNYFLQLGSKYGHLVPSSVTGGEKKEDVDDDFSKRSADLDSPSFLVSEMLVTRLGCEASIEHRSQERDKGGNVTRPESWTVSREPRQARFNIFHNRDVAEGLHVVGFAGEAADLELPKYGDAELRQNLAPSLFLSAPDAVNEFKAWSRISLLNADKALTHLSKFLAVDQQSATDHGFFATGQLSHSGARSQNGGGACITAVEARGDVGLSALDSLGRLRPSGWVWRGAGFYDNHVPKNASFPNDDTLEYSEFRRRIAVAADENAKYQDAWPVGKHSTAPRAPGVVRPDMVALRDQENCFRICEICIPACDVTVVAKPVASGDASIRLVPPDTKGWGDAQFEFRILRGHTHENLLQHRRVTRNVFVGFAVMGVATIAAGEEMIRNGYEVTYV